MSDENTETVIGGGLVEETASETVQETAQESIKPPVDSSAPEISVDFNNEDSYRAFLNTLPEDVRNSSALQQTKDFTSLTDQFLNAQRAIGRKRLEVPQDDWTDENWNNFFSNLRPENDEYSIPDEVKLPAEYGDDTQIPEFTEETQQELVDFAGQLGLTQKQFDTLYARWSQMGVDNSIMQQNEAKETLKNYKVALETDWGDDFDKNITSSRQAFNALAQEIPELNDLMQDPQLANHPGLLKLFNKVGSVTGDALPTAGSNIPGGFSNTVQGIQGEIQDIDMDYSDLILSNPSQLKANERRKREQILEKRAQLYSKLYDNKT